ncbi:hypothetical protein GSS88_09185 [Corynebacterium sp. 3HC-13]|uniref:hypothetical protein n=1 Tax=Corynebacterium poyangense TaxID=2684405 RepID=UPI001CCC9131|nr:hypothetical protein [Corynebacterium poyangense]MBZ8177958.1 hypothetical protein [Corynebacterium poyangense]
MTVSGDVRVSVLGIRIFRDSATDIVAITRLTDTDKSWSTKVSFGLYFAGIRTLWAAAGIPVVRIQGERKSVIVTVTKIDEFVDCVAKCQGKDPSEIYRESTFMRQSAKSEGRIGNKSRLM